MQKLFGDMECGCFRQLNTISIWRGKAALCIWAVVILSVAVSCAPFYTGVLSRQTMVDASINLPLYASIREEPLRYEGRLYVFGGLIADTRVAEDGSIVEVVYLPVDQNGYILGVTSPSFRILAQYPKEEGLLDPLVYKKGRKVTVAGIFKGLRAGKFEGADYTYPFFMVKEIYLWDERRYYYVPAYPYGWYDPWWDGPTRRVYGW
jgi:outer membrane lipoprotein